MTLGLQTSEYLAGTYQVVVVGGGHAGAEAALAAARMGAKTLLITLNPEAIALAPCNPAIGGPAKSTVVREIDAMGGAMALVTDQTQIQKRMLNTGKGPAVQALRAQIDKPAYQAAMRRRLELQENLDIRQGEAARLLLKHGRVQGVACRSGAVFAAPAVVLCCGTYLRGRVIIGEYEAPSGPAGLPNAAPLGQFLADLGLEMGRFKTGTPARLDKYSIDFSKTTIQKGDPGFLAFSYLSRREDVLARPSIPCWLTYTNAQTNAIVRENLHRSPLYSGRIQGVGPRYCPSFEDKVVRFAERESHQLFLEPEGLHSREYYVQGMSSSLPEDVQVAFLRTIPGLEHAVVVRPAYAIEYDCLQPTQLRQSLEHKEIAGFFSAGQLNGTSGYEEAAAQGLVAGANAAAYVLDRPPLLLERDASYIGVMLDDLVTKGVQEPYRLFTSLSEYRLLLRQDNADSRLTELAAQYGLVTPKRLELYLAKKQAVEQETARLENCRPGPAALAPLGLETKPGDTLGALLRRQGVDYAMLCALFPPPEPLEEQAAQQVEIALKYKGYIDKQRQQVERFQKLERRLLPEDLDYAQVRGLSTEAAQKLARLRPRSIGQASRITGVSPADIGVLFIHLQKNQEK